MAGRNCGDNSATLACLNINPSYVLWTKRRILCTSALRTAPETCIRGHADLSHTIAGSARAAARTSVGHAGVQEYSRASMSTQLRSRLFLMEKHHLKGSVTVAESELQLELTSRINNSKTSIPMRSRHCFRAAPTPFQPPSVAPPNLTRRPGMISILSTEMTLSPESHTEKKKKKT